MKENIFYWGPFLDSNIGTKKAIFNSAVSISKYSKRFKPVIINAIGEWEKEIKGEIVEFINLDNKIFDKLPKFGFIRSRLSFTIIFFKCFWKLKKILKENKPKYLIIHLMTSIPFMLFLIFKFKTKILFRVSGKPKLNIFRKLLWQMSEKNISLVFCNTLEQKEELIEKKIFPPEKIKVLFDPVFSIKEVFKQRVSGNLENKFLKDNIIMVGRLTKQKNFELYIEATKGLYNDNLLKYKTFIFGNGEDKHKLENLIKKYNLEKKIFLMGNKNNIHKYFKMSKVFILTSLWEDPGFVLIEAALNNLPIITSDCKSGPKEIILGGTGGFLFENNNVDDLKKKIIEFINTDKNEIRKKIFISKKNIRKYSLFKHFKLIESFINN